MKIDQVSLSDYRGRVTASGLRKGQDSRNSHQIPALLGNLKTVLVAFCEDGDVEWLLIAGEAIRDLTALTGCGASVSQFLEKEER